MMSSLKKNDYADKYQSELYLNFPSGHFLNNKKNLDHFFLWNTFFRRNLHRFAIDYLKIGLHDYQIISLYMLGISQFCVIIASRADAKSFIIALYACCVAILRPYSKIVLSSAKHKIIVILAN